MKTKTQFMKMISCFFGMLLLLIPITVLAQTKVVVIPLGDDPKPLKNIITVAKANGKFTDPVTAVNSINDASPTNPYLVVIGPGVYTISQTLQMKQYVDIAGSGENVTKIRGTISTGTADASSAIISGVTNAALSSLTVENTSGGGNSIALYNSNASPTVSNVTLTASGGATNYGVYNLSSSPTMMDMTAEASGGATYNYGIRNSSSSPTMTNVTAKGSGGTGDNYGVYNGESSSPTMIDVTATASGGTHSYGVVNFSSSPKIRRSTMEGNTWALSTNEGSATVSQSTIMGSVWGGANNICVACNNDYGAALGANCE